TRSRRLAQPVASSPSRSCAAAVTQGLRRARHGLVPLTTWCQGLACRGEPCSTRPGGTSLVSLPRIAQGAAAVDSQQAELLLAYAPERVLPGGPSGTPQHWLNYGHCERHRSGAPTPSRMSEPAAWPDPHPTGPSDRVA